MQFVCIHVDQLDTPREITDTGGVVVWQWDNVDPFGNNVPNENPSGLGTFKFDLRFPGQVADRETNTFYNTYRDAYDPALDRYTQSDPIGLAGDLNPYAYVGGNPLSRIDPRGLSARDVDVINKRFREIVDEMTRNKQRHPNKNWNNFCRFYGLPGCEKYENCEWQTEKTIEELDKLKPLLDDKWLFDVESNFDIKPSWYPGHNWVRGKSANPTDPSLWFDPCLSG
jgi:RHS repeat-associated protein